MTEQKNTQSENSKWVPRETYDQIMEKLNAAVMENNTLKAENERLKSGVVTAGEGKYLPIGYNYH